MGVSKKRQAELEKRRRIVAANLLAGVTYREMANALNVSLGTIARDVKIILGRWQREQVDDLDEHVQIALKRLDVALNAIWDEVKDGKKAAIDRMLSIEQRRAKLLGYDAPDRLEVSGRDGGPVEHETCLLYTSPSPRD